MCSMSFVKLSSPTYIVKLPLVSCIGVYLMVFVPFNLNDVGVTWALLAVTCKRLPILPFIVLSSFFNVTLISTGLFNLALLG